MRLTQSCSFWLSGLAIAIAMTGCGGSATLVDPQAVEQAAQLKVQSPAPVVVAATPTPTPQPLVNATLKATVTNFKKATLGFIGNYTATVEVTNASPISLNGTVKVSFTKKGSVVGTPQTKDVTVAPNGSQTLTFTDSGNFLDNAQVEVVTTNGGIDGGSRQGGVY